MRCWAVIKGDLVINTIAWDGKAPWQPPKDTFIIEYDIDGENPPGIGWTYDGQKFIPPKNG